MSHIISMHRPGDPRYTAVTDLFKVIACLVAPRFEDSTVVVTARQHNQLAIAAFEHKNEPI